ncbi:hypothetical protein CY35_04G097300 [Sphagnum magellanicum]|nr:hypothetical protein CY35_04G097300 [Sphagnum magellanicum]
MAMTNRVSRGVWFIDTGLVPWLLLLSFSLSWDQVSKQQLACSSPSCCCCNILIHCQPFQW